VTLSRQIICRSAYPSSEGEPTDCFTFLSPFSQTSAEMAGNLEVVARS